MAKLGLGDARIGFLREELRSSQDRERFQSPGRRETRSIIRMIIIIMSTVWGRTGVRNDQALRPTHTHTVCLEHEPTGRVSLGSARDATPKTAALARSRSSPSPVSSNVRGLRSWPPTAPDWSPIPCPIRAFPAQTKTRRRLES